VRKEEDDTEDNYYVGAQDDGDWDGYWWTLKTQRFRGPTSCRGKGVLKQVADGSHVLCGLQQVATKPPSFCMLGATLRVYFASFTFDELMLRNNIEEEKKEKGKKKNGYGKFWGWLALCSLEDLEYEYLVLVHVSFGPVHLMSQALRPKWL
jgi:hypothetical protein